MGVFNFPEFLLNSQKVLPTVYEDSLSYYETLGKTVAYLNQMSRSMNALANALVSPYSSEVSYSAGMYCWNNDKLYKCITANYGTWNLGDWEEVVFVPDISERFKVFTTTIENDMETFTNTVEGDIASFEEYINNELIKYEDILNSTISDIAEPYSDEKTYSIGDYVSYITNIDPDEIYEYDEHSVYTWDMYCRYNGFVYRCLRNTGLGPWNSDDWEKVGTLYKCIESVATPETFDADKWESIVVVDELIGHINELWDAFVVQLGIANSLGNRTDLAISQKAATDAIESIRSRTQNIWLWGDQECNNEYVTISNILIPAGTYTLSAIVNTSNTSNINCRIAFYRGNIVEQLANPYLPGDGERHNATFELAKDCNSMRIFAGIATTSTSHVTWEMVQLEQGTEATDYVPLYTANDYNARNAIAKINQKLPEIDSIDERVTNNETILSFISEENRNIWAWGNQHCERAAVIIRNILIPAGTYTISAVVTSDNESNKNSRIAFYANQLGSQLANPYLNGDGIRHSTTFTLAQDCNSIQLFPGLSSTNSSDVIWENIQLEEGSIATPYTEYGYSAKDLMARSYISDNEEKIATIPAITEKLNLITEPSNNIWRWGNKHCEGTYVTISNIAIPAGTYTLSAVVTNDSTSNKNSRIVFYAGRIVTELARPYLAGDGIRHNVTFTLAQECNSIRLWAGTTSSSTNDVVWNDVQLEEGIYETAYSSVYTGIDSKARSLSNSLTFAVKDFIGTHSNKTITIPVNQYGGKNTPVVCTIDAKYETTTMPPVFRSYIVTDRGFKRGSRYYIVGNANKFSIKSFRSVPYIWDSRTVYLQLIVPDGCTLYVKNAYCENSTQINGNYSLKFFAHDGCCGIAPPQTLPAYKMAKASGYSSGIIIPKISSTGVWFAYHDDTYDSETTKLRTASGETPSSAYNGMVLSEVPWSYLQTLYYTTFGKQFEEEQLMLVSDFLEFCALTGFDPTFSMHPLSQMTPENIQSLYNLVNKYNLVDKLTIKCPVIWDEANSRYSSAGISRMFAVFGNKVKQYTLNATQGMSDPTIIIGLMNNLTTITTRKVVEFWHTQYLSDVAAYTTTVANAKGYGLGVGCACSETLTSSELSTIIDIGVDEFTEDTNTSNGLNWYN